jgi:hypothetical protein
MEERWGEARRKAECLWMESNHALVIPSGVEEPRGTREKFLGNPSTPLRFAQDDRGFIASANSDSAESTSRRTMMEGRTRRNISMASLAPAAFPV